MKDSILKISIDFCTINFLIDKFECVKGEKPSYIIMNTWTVLKVGEQLSPLFHQTESGYKFKGIPIAVYDGLKNGEVEVL